MKANKVTVLSEDKQDTTVSVEQITPKVEVAIPFDNRILPSEEYHRLWCKVIVDFTDTEPIIAMCCNNAVDFSVENDKLMVGFSNDANMLLLEDKQNKEIILDKLYENRRRLNTVFYVVEEEKDDTAEKIERIKNLFDSKILKITKK